MIGEICTLTGEALKCDILSIVRLNKIYDSQSYESSPDYIFSVTYPSNAIKNILQKISDKLSGKSKQGMFILSGGYGTGKSHILVFLYHLFKYSDKAETWLNGAKISFKVPNAKVIAIQLLDPGIKGIDHLWEPIFKGLSKEQLLNEIKDFPTVSLLRDVFADETVVILLDELEAWYEAKDDIIKKRNLNFLQNLCEVAHDKNVLAFVSVYGYNKDLIGRTWRFKPYVENLTTAADREKIILYRIFKQIDTSKAQKVIKAYVDAYKNAGVNLDDDYHQKMLETYPIHPELMKVIFDRFCSYKEKYQNTRGALTLLCFLVKRNLDKDYILISDIDIENGEEQGDFILLDRELTEKCLEDVRRNRKIKFGKEILTSILLYSLGEIDEKEKGATRRDIILSVLRPDINVNEIDATISQLRAYYLWPIDGKWIFRKKEEPTSVIDNEARAKIERGEVQNALDEIKDIIKGKIGRTKAEIIVCPLEEVGENKKFKVVVSLSNLDDDGISEFYRGKSYQNTIILVLPKVDLINDKDMLTKAQRVRIASEKLREYKDRERRKIIENLRERDVKELEEKVSEAYGLWVKALGRDEKGKIKYRLIECSLDKIEEKVKISFDQSLIEDEIRTMLKEKKGGIKIDDIFEDFCSILGKPIILDKNKLYEAIENLCSNDEIVIEKSGKIYAKDNLPPRIDDSMIIKLRKYYKPPEEVIATPQTTADTQTHEEGSLVETPTTAPAAQQVAKSETISKITVEEAKPKVKTLNIKEEGKTPYLVVSKLESKLTENDIISGQVIIHIDNYTKSEILELIEKLPSPKDGENIKVNLSVIRRKE